MTKQHRSIRLGKFILINWENCNLAFRLNDVKEVISGRGSGKNLHPLYKGSRARGSDYKLLTKNECLIPSNIKPIQIEGKELDLDRQSSNVLGNKFDFITYENGNIAIALRNIK